MYDLHTRITLHEARDPPSEQHLTWNNRENHSQILQGRGPVSKRCLAWVTQHLWVRVKQLWDLPLSENRWPMPLLPSPGKPGAWGNSNMAATFACPSTTHSSQLLSIFLKGNLRESIRYGVLAGQWWVQDPRWPQDIIHGAKWGLKTHIQQLFGLMILYSGVAKQRHFQEQLRE